MRQEEEGPRGCTFEPRQHLQGRRDHKTYRGAVKEAIGSACKDGASNNSSQRSMAKAACEQLQAAGVSLSVRRCCTLVQQAVLTGTVPSPQKPGGTFVSTAIEERIVKLIKGYRGRKLPVFGDDVMGWCTELIRGTVYEKNFPPGGRGTEGWYRKFLHRTGMTTGIERPLEITRGSGLPRRTCDATMKWRRVCSSRLEWQRPTRTTT